MTEFQTDRYRDSECVAEFDQLFPKGFAGPDVMSEVMGTLRCRACAQAKGTQNVDAPL